MEIRAFWDAVLRQDAEGMRAFFWPDARVDEAPSPESGAAACSEERIIPQARLRFWAFPRIWPGKWQRTELVLWSSARSRAR